MASEINFGLLDFRDSRSAAGQGAGRVQVIRHVHANRLACIYRFARESFYYSLPGLNRSLYFFFHTFRLFNGFFFLRFISELNIERNQFLQSFLCVFQGCSKVPNHTFDDR